jgi:hypothetical protein
LKDFVSVNKNKFSDGDRARLQALSEEKGIPIDLSVEVKVSKPLNQEAVSASFFQNNALADNGQKYNENVEEAASCLFAQSADAYLGIDMSGLCAGGDAGGEFKPISDFVNQISNSDFVNQISNSVISSILEGVSADKKDVMYDRGKFWGDVLEKCVEKGDICSAMAIYAALNSASISRMFFKNKTEGSGQEPRDGVPASVLNALNNFSNIASPSKSNAGQRKYYEEHKELPCIPYFGIFLSDATFIYEGNKDKEQGNRIPMSGKLVEENRHRQKILQESVSVRPKTMMQLVDVMNGGEETDKFDAAMYKKSLEIIPRDPKP